MTPGDFLRAVWPQHGPYCLAYPFRTQNDPAKTLFKHVVFDTITDAEAWTVSERLNRDIYFAVFSLREREVFDPHKHNYKTGEMGAMAVRKHANMLATKAYFFDIDVGPTKDYASQSEALAALIRFVTETQLSKPTVISSGRGLHIYWLLDVPLAVEAWKPTAVYLRQLANHHGLKVDPSRTVDISSILRVPGTFNLKDPAAPLAVELKLVSAPTPAKAFQRLVTDALTRAGITGQQVPKHPGSPSPFGESNLTPEYDGVPPHITDVARACAQLRPILRTRGDCAEPVWMHAIVGTALYARSDTLTGEQLVHSFSSRYRGYTVAETDAKIAYRRERANAPTSCAKIAEVSPQGLAGCIGCPFANDASVPNPIVAARRSARAPQPALEQLVAGVPHVLTLPDPPKPYTRLKDGGIARKGKNADGDETSEVIYPYDLFPIRRLVNVENGSEQQLWCVDLPREGKKEFLLNAHVLYDSRKFTEAISHQGIYPHKALVPYLQDYMVAYISELQKLIDADAQCNHLGWVHDHTEFVLPDKILAPDGQVKAAMLSISAQRSTEYVRACGEVSKQVNLLHFYNYPKYIANQLFICSSLGSVLFYMTGHHGVVLNASGEAGSSKSTTLYTAASLWGDPEQYPLNGTNTGATTRARHERVSTFANLPICVDEITHLSIRDATDLVMGITQPGHRLRLHNDGSERKSSSAYKATIMLTTANTSLHALLSSDNSSGTAGSMRVFEIEFRPAEVHEKWEADQFLRELKKNYGHIGPLFVAYVVANRAAVETRLHALMREIDAEAAIRGSERFWSAEIASAVLAAEIARELRLLPYDPVAIRRHAIDVQVPRNRSVVGDEYATPLGILTDYIAMIHGNIIVLADSAFAGGTKSYVQKEPANSALLGHYDTGHGQLWLLKKGFKDYCRKLGANGLQVLDELAQLRADVSGQMSRVVTHKHIRKTLGAGTQHTTTQASCIIVNMKHPELAEVIDTRPANALRVVS